MTQDQGQGSSGHRPKGGSPYDHMVSAHRLARSRISMALQDVDDKRQHRAADRARDEEPSWKNVPQFPCHPQSLLPRAKCGFRGPAPGRGSVNPHSPQLHTQTGP